MKNRFAKVLAAFLCLLMLMGVMPFSAFAAEGDAVAQNSGDFENAQLSVITNDKSTLAPGVTLNELAVYDKNNERVEMYITTVDTKVDTVKVLANYMDNQNSVYGMQTLSKQVAAMEANYPEPFKVVAGINASYYNVNTGKPTGAFVMEGIDVTTESEGNAYAFFAVLKDGTYMIGAKGEYSSYKGQIKEAIGGYIHIVKDGAIVSGLDAKTKYPRQTLGLTADGKLILMTADGSQAPVTVGLTVQEQAQVMYDLGCVEAIHLDGGNSATFGTVPEGTEEFVLTNTPSGQAERDVSNTLVIATTAVSDGKFHHAMITGAYELFVPFSSYAFTASGVDAAGGPADEIPADVEWALSDSSFGTVSDGVFVSNGKLGNVDVQMVQNGNVVGTKSISIVNPDRILYDAAKKTVPYGKTMAITVTAMRGINEVYSDASAYSFVLSNTAIGTIEGFAFTATTDETVKSSALTATYKYADVASASVTIELGKGSETIFDFEDGDINDWLGTDKIGEWIDEQNKLYPNPTEQPILKPQDYGNSISSTGTNVFLATEESGGKVKNGKYSLAVTLDRLYSDSIGSWIYNYLYYTGETQVWRDVANGKNAIRIGMWLNVPDTNTALRICRTFTKDSSGTLYTNYDYMTSAYDGKKVSYNTNYAYPESGWIYVYFDLSSYAFQSSTQYNPDDDYGVNNGKGTDGNYYPAFIQFINGSGSLDNKNFTFYIDDITLDYSDVIDDRDAPIISDATVSETVDSFAAINGQTLKNNTLSFSAKIAEDTSDSNFTGLDYSSAKIYIDGMDMSTAASFKAAGSVLTLADVYLCDGKHEIVFQIADKYGNYTKLTKNFVVDGTADNAIVSITGRNDSGAIPKAGSLYYLDIKATDAAQIKTIVVSVKLDTVNAFELDNIIAIKGIEYTYEYDKPNNTVTLSIVNNSTLNGDSTLLTIPVRVWSWSEEITGVPASKQWGDGTTTPIVKIEVKTVYGKVEFENGVVDSKCISGFYSNFVVDTELNRTTKWHEHDAKVLDNKAATCTDDGYTNRTYCDGCASIIAWGDTVQATGHTYSVNLTNKNLVCHCGDTFKGSGLIEVDGNNYYVIAGNLTSGWMQVGEDWYLFDDTSFAGIDGKHYTDKAIEFVFDKGRVTSGVWVKMRDGYRYWYGPKYYKKNTVTATHNAVPYEIDGDTYFFDTKGYMQTGIIPYRDSHRQVIVYYDCGTDGKSSLLTGPYNGYYYVDGEKTTGYKLYEKNGNYYFVGSGNKLAVNTTLTLSAAHVAGVTYSDGTAIPAGSYSFDAEGKMIVKNGPVNGFFYKNNTRLTAYRTVEYNGDLYFIGSSHKLAVNTKLYLSASHVAGATFADGTPLPEGYYEFDADGKMIIKNGPVNGFFYKNNARLTAYRTVEYNGDLYFIGSSHKLAKNTKLYLSASHVAGATFADGTPLSEGYYEFDADGKMIIKNGPVDGFFYENNVRVNAYRTVEYNGDLYFIGSSHKLAKNTKLYLSASHVAGATFADGTPLPEGYYEFDTDGKMIIKNGPVDGFFYKNNVRLTAYKLVEYNGDFYFIGSGNKLAVNQTLNLSAAQIAGATYPDGTPITAGSYSFDADGKMLVKNGPVGNYFYKNNVRVNAYNLVEYNGDLYFVGAGNKLAVNTTLYLSASHVAGKTYADGSMIEIGNHTFDAEGKLIVD